MTMLTVGINREVRVNLDRSIRDGLQEDETFRTCFWHLDVGSKRKEWLCLLVQANPPCYSAGGIRTYTRTFPHARVEL